MSRNIDRRSFLKKSAALGVTTFLGSSLFPADLPGEAVADISVVRGVNYLENTMKAIELLGGMEKFVPKDSRVAILANPQRNNPGAYTSPEVLRAVIRMCKKVGVHEVACISWLPKKNWNNTGLKKVIETEGANLQITNLKDETLFKPVAIPKGKALKEARIIKSAFNYDILINVPITKDHAGNKFTGTLKNFMGLNSPVSNRTFHKEDWETNKSSIEYLDQKIADLNTVVKADLYVVDATEFIITNGPFGPGKLLKPQKVVAGIDRVAIDAYCSTLWGLTPAEIFMIKQAHEHGLGEMNLEQVKIVEKTI